MTRCHSSPQRGTELTRPTWINPRVRVNVTLMRGNIPGVVIGGIAVVLHGHLRVDRRTDRHDPRRPISKCYDKSAQVRRSLKNAFDRAKRLQTVDAEIQSDLARYLCVLVSGFVETAVAELAVEHCRSRSASSVLNYASTQLDRLQNLKSQKLVQVIGSFERNWSIELTKFMDGARKDALDSVIDLRNKIAHGESVSLSLGELRISRKIDEVIVFIEKLLK